MRLSHLHLLAYGKFTDRELTFPASVHDFHVIIGPNEAGKSTVRRAIAELLFGIELRSPLGFKHPQNELRVGGVLESGGAAFPFIRTKQHKSVRSLAGEALPDSYLAPALGSLRPETFEELHCLDHARLLRGGQGIVDPKNSVSQILFQAASGLEDFTAVREALADQAGALFAKGGRNHQFARTAEKLTLAQKTLREVQVRTKGWVDARDALQAAEQALEIERDRRRQLGLQRTAWDRARRLAPLVDTLARLQAEVQELGEVVEFPPGAGKTLQDGIERMAAAGARLQTRDEDLARAQADLDGIAADDPVLGQAAAIAALGALCGLHPNHARDLPVRRAEVQTWLAEVVERSAPFGWGATEDEVRARLPGDSVVRAIEALLKSRGGLLAEERAATEALAERQATVDDLQQRLSTAASPADPGLDTPLLQALEAALPYKAGESRQQALAGAAGAARTAADNALAALGRPHLTAALLRSLRLPAPERVTALRAERRDIVQAASVARSLADKGRGAAVALALKLQQFQRTHQVVTLAEVSQARRERDARWSHIKSGQATLADGAPALDLAIRLADELADSRTRSEADAAEVQSLRDQIERADADNAQHQAALDRSARELAGFDARWAATADAMGLAGMALDDLPDWLARRDGALAAADAAAHKQQEQEAEQHNAARARRELVSAITGAGVAAGDSPGLATLCALAGDHLERAKAARERRADLQQRVDAAQAALRVATQALASKAQAVRDWNASWAEVLVRANLGVASGDVVEVERAMVAWDSIRQHLDRVANTRSERIQTMEADLQRMQQGATELAAQVAPDLGGSAPEQVFASLQARLEQARLQLDRRVQAQKFLDEARRQRDEAQSALTEARRTLEPLLRSAGVDDPLAAVPIVACWQARLDKLAAIGQALKDLEQGADGLSLAQVQAEVAAHPAIQAAGEVLRLQEQLGDSETRLTTLVAAQLGARQAFDGIDGGDRAAVAEAQRHEALAELSDVSEQYLQLATAGSLLRWAVDRYRDRKQGPLLERASSVFQGLTRGSFQKLRVDFEQVPPALVAWRPADNQPVKVAGLSDGTRDQLFLALRIAALELQSEQGDPVPFIADDLFINFDDSRSQAGLAALHELSSRTQVLFLSHQEHLLPLIRQQFPQANVVELQGGG